MMARPATHPMFWRRRTWCGAMVILAAAVLLVGSLLGVSPSLAQMLAFPPRPGPRPTAGTRAEADARSRDRDQLRLHQRTRVGGRQRAALLWRLDPRSRSGDLRSENQAPACGRKCRTDPGDGMVTYGEIMDLSDDYRDGFVDSLRIDAPEHTRFAAARAERTAGNFTVFQNGVYTACEPCKDDPQKPPKWQVKAVRIIHDQSEKMLYFEDAKLEFLGVPSPICRISPRPIPTVKRKTGLLVPTYQHQLGLRRRRSRSPTIGRWHRITTRPSRR